MNLIKTNYAYYKSPIGILKITFTNDSITAIKFTKKKEINTCNNSVIDGIINQLDEYFKGHRKQFTLKIKLIGTPFQKRVWQELLKIPYGTTTTYLKIAHKIKNPKASRAVGQANNKNPIAIIIPCHRVIGSNNNLTGYASGIGRKQWLLKHEQKFSYHTKNKPSNS